MRRHIMLLKRRILLLLSILTFSSLIVVVLRRRTRDPLRNAWVDVSQQLAQQVGLGEQWLPSTENTSDVDRLSNAVAQEEFNYGVGKPPDYNFSKMLVVATTKKQKENTTWIEQELPDFPKAIYVADDPTAPLHPPTNKGHEVMVYLTYLIDNYENLPDVMIFMHSHRRTWHNADLLGLDAVEMIRRLNLARVAREGFMNMRCQWFPGCPDWIHPGETEKNRYKTEQLLMAKSFAELFPFEPIPKVLAQPCCSQFALSRDLVLTIPKAKFVAWRNWVLNTNLWDSTSGRVWEYIWQFAFTGKNTLCPVEHICYCDGFGVCFGSPQSYDAFYRIRFERDKYNRELLEWTAMGRKIEKALNEGKSTAGMEFPEPGRDDTLRMQIEALQKELNKRLGEALQRGNDPQLRAEETGRIWQEGDGF